MPKSNLKNIVVLKNLPSNLIDEAILILKSNKTAKKLEYIEKRGNVEYKESRKTNDYVIKEAESVISNYISRLEKNRVVRNTNKNIEVKYKKMRTYSICVSVILAFCLIRVLIFK